MQKEIVPLAERERILERHIALNRQKAAEHPGHWVHRDRVIPLVQQFIDRIDEELGNGIIDGQRFDTAKIGSGRKTLCHLLGMGERRLWTILEGKPRWHPPRIDRHGKRKVGFFDGGQEYLPLDLVDRLFVAMDCVHLFYLSPEDGGFSDVYFHPSIVDSPVLELVAA